MASLNKVMLIGRLGSDPELKYTPAGKAVCAIRLATDGGKGPNGEKYTEWHNCVIWDKLAELVNQYTHKGSQVYVEGRLQTRSWDDKQSGQKRYTTEIIINQVTFLGERSASSGGGQAPQYGQEPRGYAQQGQGQGRGYQEEPAHTSAGFPADDDIPF